MNALITLITALGGAGVIFAGLKSLAAAIVKVIIESRDLRHAVTDNTTATSALTEKIGSHSAMLADHESRITSLEGAPNRVRTGAPPNGS